MKTRRLPEKKNDPTPKNAASFPEETAAALGAAWNINIACVHGDIAIQGSPERSLWRVVVEDTEGRWFVLEKR
jgi:hypothetical protein